MNIKYTMRDAFWMVLKYHFCIWKGAKENAKIVEVAFLSLHRLDVTVGKV